MAGKDNKPLQLLLLIISFRILYIFAVSYSEQSPFEFISIEVVKHTIE